MQQFFRPVFRSLGFMAAKDKTTYVILVGLRVITNILDIAGLAGVALFGAMLAAGLQDRDEAALGAISVPLDNQATYLWVIGSVVTLFFV